MGDQNNAQSNGNGGKGYNLKVTPVGDVDNTAQSNGTAKTKFKGKFTSQGRERTLTFVARGKAAEIVAGKIVDGTEVGLRVLFSRAPANDDGTRGGEYCEVIALPLPPKAKAA